MSLLSDKRLDELELRVAHLEKWLGAIKEHAEATREGGNPSSASSPPGARALEGRVQRIEQALVANFNVDIGQP